MAVLNDYKLLYTGKVREMYEYDAERLLLVASDRVSAFDVVFPEPVPGKGAILNDLSAWWFHRTEHLVQNHFITAEEEEIFELPPREARGRMMLVWKADPIRYECVVRGHLDGSAWREYESTGEVAGIKLPKGLKRYERLPEAIFTPATKNLDGHDENITEARMAAELGEAETQRLKEMSLRLYRYAYDFLEPIGILLLDTKFEFGRRHGVEILIDEIFTPDSSRFRMKEGANEEDAKAFDKQFLRDWLIARGFTGEGKPPALPPEIIEELQRRYRRVFELITGKVW